MCVGNSTRVSQGGSIAVLRPTQSIRQRDVDDEMHLLFSNRAAALLGRAGTQVEFRGWEASNNICRDRCWIVIHRDGDLSASAGSPAPQQNPFFSFSLDDSSMSKIELPQVLDLGVGDAGIIGRRVSVMTSSKKGLLTLAEGIIGWN